jgi:hypothetical protein
MKRLLDYLGYALDQWQVSVIKLETLKQEQKEQYEKANERDTI